MSMRTQGARTRRMDRRALFTSGAAAALLAASGLPALATPRRGGRLRLAVPRDGSLMQLAKGAAQDNLTEITGYRRGHRRRAGGSRSRATERAGGGSP